MITGYALAMPKPRTTTEKACTNCGKVFRPKSSTTGRFCSKECWYAWPGRITEIACEACSKPFRPQSKSQRACSVECGNQLKRSPNRTTTCVRCGTPLKMGVHVRVRYCSKACSTADRWDQGGFSSHHRPIGTRRTDPVLGYIKIKTENGWEFEHRVVMREILGRPLAPWPAEHVHHKDGNRANNAPGNLELRTGRTHGPGATNHCPTCTCSAS